MTPEQKYTLVLELSGSWGAMLALWALFTACGAICFWFGMLYQRNWVSKGRWF